MRPMLEDYLSEDEASQARSPKEFIKWFEQKMDLTKNHGEALKEQNILHEGIAKKFYEELFPLYRLIQRKEDAWYDVMVEYAPGDQNFDVKLESNREFMPKYVEITQADRNEGEHLRVRYFLEHGSVCTSGNVIKEGTKKIGLKISVEDEAGDGDESILGKIEQIKIAIDNKIQVTRRPDRTALLVYFDDYLKFPRGRGQEEIGAFLSKNEHWKKQYVRLFVVSASGELFWEMV